MDVHPSSAALLDTLDHLRTSQPGLYRGLASRHAVRADAATGLLVRAIEVDGGFCFPPFLRPAGICYAEVVLNVAKVLEITSGAAATVAWLEGAIADAVLESHRSKLSATDFGEWQGLLQQGGNPASLPAATVLLRKGGLTTELLAPLLAGPLRAPARRLLARAVAGYLRRWKEQQLAALRLSPAGPPQNRALALWTLQDVASPAMFRVLPTVIELAVLRLEALAVSAP